MGTSSRTDKMGTEVYHESTTGTRARFTVRVLDEGTPEQRLSIASERWVENEGFKKQWCILSVEETARIAWALNRPREVNCLNCTHYIGSPYTMRGEYDYDDRMFCDADGGLTEIRYPERPACMKYCAKAIVPQDRTQEEEGEGIEE